MGDFRMCLARCILAANHHRDCSTMAARISVAGSHHCSQTKCPDCTYDTTVTSYVDQRIEIIQQRFLATENLLELIEKYDLYPEERESLPDHVVAEKMREAISVDLLTAGSRRMSRQSLLQLISIPRIETKQLVTKKLQVVPSRKHRGASKTSKRSISVRSRPDFHSGKRDC